MTISKNTINTLSVCSLMFASSLMAASQEGDVVDLVSIAAPQHKVEQAPLHFSQPLLNNPQLSFKAKAFTSKSDEYWQEVTGRDLNLGIALHTTHPGALVRLSGKRANIEGATDSLVIDPQNIELSKGKEILSNPFSQKVTQQQFATANIFPGSSAVQLNKDIGKGKFKLKVTQKLNANERYIVNVKEKGSAHLLNVSIPKQSFLANDTLQVDMTIINADGFLKANQHQATIKTPGGEILPVNLKLSEGKYALDLPEVSQMAEPGKLYELHIASQAIDNGLTVKRNGKVAFAITQPTARMTGKVAVSQSHAMVNLDIASEGRYEITGVVSGINRQGKQETVMLSRSAYYLQPGEQSVELKFDKNILTQAQVLPPYKVSQLRLVDQSRMALLQQR